MTQDEAKLLVAKRAAELVRDGQAVGLGTGTTANFKGFSIKRADIIRDAPNQPSTPAPAVKKTDGKKNTTPPPPPVKKGPSKVDDVWYLLTCEDGTLTNFQQSDADKMIAAILPL